MRVSDIQAWSNCETMALQSPPRPAGRTNVAAWVGTLAHGMLSGIEVEPPERLAFDRTTRTFGHADIQARHIADKARQLQALQGWGVMETEQEVRRDEITGHLDIRAWHSNHGEAIIDLKTGQGVGAAWLQVGGYLTLDREGAEWGGVLHIPRTPLPKRVAGTLEVRKSPGLVRAWEVATWRIAEVMNGASPMMTPGLHCGRCTITACPVRV